MSYLPLAVLAYLFNGIAVLIDKYLLGGEVAKPFAYIFYISCFSMVVLVLLPFVPVPSWIVFLFASVSTILWTCGAFFLYKALQVGVASRVVPIVGTLIPTFLLIEAVMVGAISSSQIMGILLLIGGLILITLPEWKGRIGTSELYFEFLSAILFSISYIILREAYVQGHFLSVLVWSRIILIPLIIIVLFIPFLRSHIQFGTRKSHGLLSKNGILFLFGQMCGGISELLLTFSISLVPPALVNSLQGVQYGFLYIANFILAKKIPNIFSEETSRVGNVIKIGGLICISIGLVFLGVKLH